MGYCFVYIMCDIGKMALGSFEDQRFEKSLKIDILNVSFILLLPRLGEIV